MQARNTYMETYLFSFLFIFCPLSQERTRSIQSWKKDKKYCYSCVCLCRNPLERELMLHTSLNHLGCQNLNACDGPAIPEGISQPTSQILV